MDATEYACEFWNNPVPYPHPHFRNSHMQMGYERLPPEADNMVHEPAYFHNSYPIYRQNDEYNFAAYNNMAQFKSEDSCRYSSDQITNIAHAAINSDCDNLNNKITPPLPVNCAPNIKFEHLNEMSLRKCPYNSGVSESVSDTLNQCTAENVNQSGNDTNDSPALRALLTKPPKERPVYSYSEETKSEVECSQYLSQISNVKPTPSEFLSNSKIISPNMLNNEDRVREEKDMQQNHGETSNNYYPWMKTQGNYHFSKTLFILVNLFETNVYNKQICLLLSS